MRFFNLDCHISVIADIQHIFAHLGHGVDSWSLSGHNWVFDRGETSVDVINAQTWRNLSPAMCDAFYERYHFDLMGYDGFIVTYPPTFAWAFQQWHKPIIVVAPVRYEVPFSNQPLYWSMFNDFLRNGIDAGTILPVANSEYDARYAEHFMQRQWRHIPSLCDYTNVAWKGTKPNYVLHSRNPMPITGTIHKSAALPVGYRWADLMEFRGAVHWPYNASTMTIFESYTQGVPMFFPSPKLALSVRQKDRSGIFSELSWNQIFGMPPHSMLGERIGDPNAYHSAETMMYWAQWSDFYRPPMPHIQLFDSLDELPDRLAEFDAAECHERMMEANAIRRESVYSAWQEIIVDVEKAQDRF